MPPQQNTADVTVVIPALNRAPVLHRALDSVFGQTVRPKRVIVIDDGSTDGTSEVAAAHDVIVLRHTSPRGSAEARNRGIAEAVTEWVAFLDSDDAWAEDHLERLLRNAGDADLVSASAVDSFGRIRGTVASTPTTLRHADLFFPENLVCTSAVLVRTRALRAVGGFRTVERAEDLDLWVRLLDHGKAVTYPQVTVFYSQPTRYPDANLHARNQAGTGQVVDAFADAPWSTTGLRRRLRDRETWDQARFLLHRREVSAGLRHLSTLLNVHSISSLFTLLVHRRRARRLGRRHITFYTASNSSK